MIFNNLTKVTELESDRGYYWLLILTLSLAWNYLDSGEHTEQDSPICVWSPSALESTVWFIYDVFQLHKLAKYSDLSLELNIYLNFQGPCLGAWRCNSTSLLHIVDKLCYRRGHRYFIYSCIHSCIYMNTY